MIASCTNANPRERYELVGNRRGQEPGEEFSCEVVVSQVFYVLYI